MSVGCLLCMRYWFRWLGYVTEQKQIKTFASVELGVIVLPCLSQCPTSKYLFKETNRQRKHKAKKWQYIYLRSS